MERRMEMKKSGIDMLHGSIWNKIPLFALPVAATAILGQLFNASDLAVVGNFAGEARTAAVAAVGANSSVVSLVVNLFTGVALGANVVIAGAIGREDTDAAQRAVHTALLFAVIGGFVIALLGEFMAEPLLRMMSVPDEVLPLALLYCGYTCSACRSSCFITLKLQYSEASATLRCHLRRSRYPASLM